MRPLGWAVIQYGWCPKKRRSGHGYIDLVKAEEEDSHLQAVERSLRRNHTCRYFDLGYIASGTVRKLISVFKTPSIWYFIMEVLVQ